VNLIRKQDLRRKECKKGVYWLTMVNYRLIIMIIIIIQKETHFAELTVLRACSAASASLCPFLKTSTLLRPAEGKGGPGTNKLEGRYPS
jgi:hypothetical protein